MSESESWIVTGTDRNGISVWCEVFVPDRATALKFARWTYPAVHWGRAYWLVSREQAVIFGREITQVQEAKS